MARLPNMFKTKDMSISDFEYIVYTQGKVYISTAFMCFGLAIIFKTLDCTLKR